MRRTVNPFALENALVGLTDRLDHSDYDVRICSRPTANACRSLSVSSTHTAAAVLVWVAELVLGADKDFMSQGMISANDRIGKTAGAGKAGGAAGPSNSGGNAASDRTVWIGGIPEQADQKEVQKVFEMRFGGVESLAIRFKKGDRKSWGFCIFAEKESKAAAAFSMSASHRLSPAPPPLSHSTTLYVRTRQCTLYVHIVTCCTQR